MRTSVRMAERSKTPDSRCTVVYLSSKSLMYGRSGPVRMWAWVRIPLALKLTAKGSVAQSVERWSRDPGSLVQFPAGGLGVAFFATGPDWVLKCISF